MSKTKFFFGLFTFILIVSLVFLYIGKMHLKSEVYSYLPHLRKYNLYDVKFEKIYADPSYTMPYNILISFKTDTQNLFFELGLKNIHTVDTAMLRSATWVDEYSLYFTMHSLNAVRYKAIESEVEMVKWWNVANCNNYYAAPYSDLGNKRGVVKFGQKNNGRIVCCRIGNTYYLLIECWG